MGILVSFLILGWVYSFAIWNDVSERFFINVLLQVKKVTFYTKSVEFLSVMGVGIDQMLFGVIPSFKIIIFLSLLNLAIIINYVG